MEFKEFGEGEVKVVADSFENISAWQLLEKYLIRPIKDKCDPTYCELETQSPLQ